ncbi:hypothetical protein B0H13DRAFT_2276766 [Mycena leptocephala]|nr:hypothetical protein B0H13DRAFT_2276766 [Mycena leptocephala]
MHVLLCQMPCHAFERTFPSYGAIEHDESGRHPRMRRGRLVTLRYRGNRENRQKSLVSSAWMYCFVVSSILCLVLYPSRGHPPDESSVDSMFMTCETRMTSAVKARGGPSRIGTREGEEFIVNGISGREGERRPFMHRGDVKGKGSS